MKEGLLTNIRAAILDKQSRCEQSPGMAKGDLTQNKQLKVLQYREAVTELFDYGHELSNKVEKFMKKSVSITFVREASEYKHSILICLRVGYQHLPNELLIMNTEEQL